MLAMHQVAKFYGPHAAVRDLDLAVQAGELVGLLGLNGAGKTTALQLMAGQLAASAGSIYIDGIDLAADGPRARARIGFLPQVPPLYPEMRVADYLDFAAAIREQGPLDRPTRGRRVGDALAACGLEARAGERIASLSDGTRRRVGIAQAMMHRPPLILLDEPTAGLDPVQVVHMRGLIAGLRGRATVLVSSHILGDLKGVDRLFVLHAGRLVASGSEAELARQLSGAPELLVEVDGDLSAAAAALNDLPGVEGWRQRPPEGTASGRLELVVSLRHDARAEVAASLVGAGLRLYRLEQQTLGLEKIFLALTGAGAGPGTKIPSVAAAAAAKDDF